MKITILLLTAALLLTVSCDQAHMRQAQVAVPAGDSELDREFHRLLRNDFSLDERKRQVPAITSIFARHTSPRRASRLAIICYLKTLGSPFMPLDLAEIALAETGGHGLSAKAVSNKGALGVWQLMPQRAASHGYSPNDMGDDEKCATAAVLELASKLEMADGNLVRAKKLYCGVGAEADAYEVKRRHFRRALLAELGKGLLLEAKLPRLLTVRPS
jgi:hypothetical protein